MKLHSFEHVPYEGLDRIGDWAAARGHQTSATRFYAEDPLPATSAIDALIIMGGPMGVYDTAEFPWMIQEMEFIRQMIKTGKPVLGICLGAQLIAGALGAKVYRHTQKEIGWWPVQFAPYPVKGTALEVFGPEAMMFHWHGDTFNLPPNAVHLGTSEACRYQAYSVGKNVLALQFHPEISAATIDRWVQESGSIKNPHGFVMSEADMKRHAADYLPALDAKLPVFLDRFFV
jgi:GMP synthase-like glutamine amidotransferase